MKAVLIPSARDLSTMRSCCPIAYVVYLSAETMHSEYLLGKVAGSVPLRGLLRNQCTIVSCCAFMLLHIVSRYVTAKVPQAEHFELLQKLSGGTMFGLVLLNWREACGVA